MRDERHVTLPDEWALAHRERARSPWVSLIAREQPAPGMTWVRSVIEAEDGYRTVLVSFSRDWQPIEWARTQNNLGDVLATLAGMEEGADVAQVHERMRHIGEAVAAYHAALEVRTREAMPAEWARTQSALGNALNDLSGLVLELGETEQPVETGQDGTRVLVRARHLLVEAVACQRAALTVFARETLPEDWALAQSGLGEILNEQAALVEDAEERTRLTGEAITAVHAALEVFTERRYPTTHRAVLQHLWHLEGLQSSGHPNA